MSSVMRHVFILLKTRIFLILWISMASYIFYDSFIYYKVGRKFYYLRLILGRGLCVSRATATVLNLCCTLVLLPLCKKLNLVLYMRLSRLWPGLFFFWLERAKSFHMTVAITLLSVALIHSISHFINLWNFSRHYDEVRKDVNVAHYKNENPFHLIISPTGLTGVTMLLIILAMGLMSLKVVRQKFYNVFWYTHQLYLLFITLFIVHPLSGALKEEVLINSNQAYISGNCTKHVPKFIAIQSNSWKWLALPLFCYFTDLIWRITSRNNSKVDIIEVTHMAGRTIRLVISCPNDTFFCRAGQYILLQCVEVSVLEWHPFTVVSVPTSSQRHFTIWIRVRGDWTKALEKCLIQKCFEQICLLVDGPYSSPMERTAYSEVAICVAAGVGITPFVAMLEDMIKYPRKRLPGRVHLIWIVKNENEFSWLADLANKCLLKLRYSNRPDRLHLELYVTSQINNLKTTDAKIAMVNEKGQTSLLHQNEDKLILLTPQLNKKEIKEYSYFNIDDKKYSLAKSYPILGCRIKKGRPYWDGMFSYWGNLYPKQHVNIFCCGPRQLVKTLQKGCERLPAPTKTKFTFNHEKFG